MQHHIIDTYEKFLNLKEYFDTQSIDHITLDVETNNKVERLAKLYGIGICISPTEAFYFPWRTKQHTKWWANSFTEKDIIDWIIDLCKKHGTIGYNIIYDVLVLKYNWGVDLTDTIYSDVILQKHTLNEERPHGLKDVSERYLGPHAKKAQEKLFLSIVSNGGKTTKDQLDIYKADTDVIAEYCAWDCVLTRQLFDLFEPQLKSEGLWELFYEQEIMHLYRSVTIPMKDKGFPVDVEHFKKLDADIALQLIALENQIQENIKPSIENYIQRLLDEEYPVKRTGMFPKYYAQCLGIELPRDKNGKMTIAKKAIEQTYYQMSFKNKLEDIVNDSTTARSNQLKYFDWLLNGADVLDYKAIDKMRRDLWCNEHDTNYVFNLRSNDALKFLFFSQLREKPLSTTEKGEPQIDDDFLTSIKHKYNWVQLLIDFKKLTKLKTTYVEGILEKQINGVIYPSLLQFGTTSGRDSCINPNLQNLPRAKEDDSGLTPLVLKYVNSIRAGFVAPKDYVLIDADESALEPRCFATMSACPSLQAVFKNKDEDLYSFIAIKMFNEVGVSSNKKAPNYLGNIKPELRGMIKAFCLAVVYGAGANRIADVLGVDKYRAQQLIDMYFDAFPELKNYIDQCHRSAKLHGKVKTTFGRIRHLPRVKQLYSLHKDNLFDWSYIKRYGYDQEKYEYKNGLNNSTNFPIQGLAAHIINRSSINIAHDIKRLNLRAYIALKIHDQIILICHKDDAHQVQKLTQYHMEHSVKIDVPLVAEPTIAHNLRDSHGGSGHFTQKLEEIINA